VSSRTLGPRAKPEDDPYSCVGFFAPDNPVASSTKPASQGCCAAL